MGLKLYDSETDGLNLLIIKTDGLKPHRCRKATPLEFYFNTR